MGVEIRKVVKQVGETGPTGPTTRDEVSYELGGEIDGVFVPFVTVGESRVEDFRARSEADKAGDEAGDSSSEEAEPEPPNEPHTVSETSAAQPETP